MFLEHADKTAI